MCASVYVFAVRRISLWRISSITVRCDTPPSVSIVPKVFRSA
jgi:hypothetical protein